jgi:hypothetical protein
MISIGVLGLAVVVILVLLLFCAILLEGPISPDVDSEARLRLGSCFECGFDPLDNSS